MTGIAEQATHTTVTLSASDKVNQPLPPSIRSIIRGDIIKGVPQSETKRKIMEWHATSKAAEKFAKHYGWYKGQIKKEEKNGASLPLMSE